MSFSSCCFTSFLVEVAPPGQLIDQGDDIVEGSLGSDLKTVTEDRMNVAGSLRAGTEIQEHRLPIHIRNLYIGFSSEHNLAQPCSVTVANHSMHG